LEVPAAAEYLDRREGDRGLVTADGDPVKALAELRSLSMELSRLEASLGITAVARAGLGVDIGRMRRLANGASEPHADDVDVAELERRYVEGQTSG
jgi:hypothetical protein